jgi:hypothetical protein
VRQVTIENNRILSDAPRNAEVPSQSAAIFFGEVRRKQTADGATVNTPLREITLKNNTIVASNPERFLTNNYFYFDPTNPSDAEVKADYEAFMKTLKSSGNTWYGADATPFHLTSSKGYAEEFDFSGWKTLTKQDGDSQFTNAGLTCPN